MGRFTSLDRARGVRAGGNGRPPARANAERKEHDAVTLNDLVNKIKRQVDFSRVGMIACHNGVVRGTSRAGEAVECLDIDVDTEIWDRILQEMRTEPGIAAVEAYLFRGRRRVGDDVMLIAVAGDIRENVLPVLEKTLNRLKKEAVKKGEKLLMPDIPIA
jgi:molybdopterin synthase catalytic subunit